MTCGLPGLFRYLSVPSSKTVITGIFVLHFQPAFETPLVTSYTFSETRRRRNPHGKRTIARRRCIYGFSKSCRCRVKPGIRFALLRSGMVVPEAMDETDA